MGECLLLGKWRIIEGDAYDRDFADKRFALFFEVRLLHWRTICIRIRGAGCGGHDGRNTIGERRAGVYSLWIESADVHKVTSVSAGTFHLAN